MNLRLPAKNFPSIKAYFPGYRKRNISFQSATSVSCHDGHWSGGSITYYYQAKVEGKNFYGFQPINPNSNPFTAKPGGPTKIEIAPGTCVIETGTFCGKPAEMYVSMHEADMAALESPEESK